MKVVVIDKKTISSWPTQAEAVAAAAKKLRLEPKSFQLAKPILSRVRDLSSSLRTIFRFLNRIYTRKSGQNDALILPGDLQDIRAYGENSTKQVAMESSSFVVPMALAKFGPERKVVENSAKKFKESIDRGVDIDKAHYLALRQAATNIVALKRSTMQPWHDQVGKRNLFHSGLINYLRQSMNLVINKGGSKLRFAPLGPALRAKLQKTRCYGDVLVRATTPTKTAEMVEQLKALANASKGVPGFRTPSSYRTLWLLRTHLEFRLARDNITLRAAPSDSVGSIVNKKWFPDQGGYVKKLLGVQLKGMKYSKFAKTLGYLAG